MFSSIYDSDGITGPALFLALDSFAINYIDASDKIGEFDPSDSLAPTSSFRPSLSNGEVVYSSTSQTITVPGLRLSRPGSVYFILTFNKKITFNEITGAAEI